jgi:hypothetical protein
VSDHDYLSALEPFRDLDEFVRLGTYPDFVADQFAILQAEDEESALSVQSSEFRSARPSPHELHVAPRFSKFILKLLGRQGRQIVFGSEIQGPRRNPQNTFGVSSDELDRSCHAVQQNAPGI